MRLHRREINLNEECLGTLTQVGGGARRYEMPHATPDSTENQHREELADALQNMRIHNEELAEERRQEEEELAYQEYLEEVSSPFDPPLYHQRYIWVVDKIQKVLGEKKDVTVGELGFASFKSFLNIKQLKNITKIIGVDKCLNELNLNNIKPFPGEYIIPRENKLEVIVLKGDLGLIDDRLKNLDFLSMIEIIEHIEFEELENIMNIVMNIYRPNYLAVTTPNIEFNCYFSNEQNKFRHPDHKFEFTRFEFEQWCSNLANSYNYSYEIEGIGYIENFSEENGCCSQSVLFKNNSPENRVDLFLEENFQLIHKIIYPYETKEEKEEKRLKQLNQDIKNCISNFGQKYLDESNEEYIILEQEFYNHFGLDLNKPAYCIPIENLEQTIRSKLGEEIQHLDGIFIDYVKQNDLIKLTEDEKFFIFVEDENTSDSDNSTNQNENNLQQTQGALIEDQNLFLEWN